MNNKKNPPQNSHSVEGNNNIINISIPKTYQNSKSIENISTYINPDFMSVQWNPDYTNVAYLDIIHGKEQKIWVLMRKFFEMFPNKENRPEIKAISPKPVLENVIELLRHYKINVKRNIFTEQIEVYKDGTYNKTLQLNEVYLKNIAIKHLFKIPQTFLIDCIVSIAWDNSYNPIEIFLKQCHAKHKGKKGAIQQLCDTIQSDVTYKDEYITRWLVQSVALAVSADSDNNAAHYMLVFQGGQGEGKTAWGANLLPKSMQENYFLGGRILDVGNKDHIMEQASRFIVELGEITSTFNKSDKEALKNYITTVRDVYRPPYWKETVNKKRRVSFYGTVNDLEFLYDSTGSRRFLVIPTKKIDYMHNIDVSELWSEVYALYLSGYQYWFTPEECQTVTRRNAQFTAQTDVMSVIQEFYELYPIYNEPETPFTPNKGKWLLAREIADYINARVSVKEQVTAKTLGKQLKQANVLSKPARMNKVLFYLEELNNQKEQQPIKGKHIQSKLNF